jgi:hypothetical protein
MISVQELKSFEKQAASIGETVWKGVGGTLKLMGKYPKTTLAGILGVAGTVALADKIHPIHQIVREETKHRGEKEQTNILRGILEAQKTTTAKSGHKPQEKMAIKLSSYKTVSKAVAKHVKKHRGKYSAGGTLTAAEVLRQRNRNRNIITGSLDQADD